MRTWTETHQAGTDVGPVDWTHPWVAESRFPIETLRAVEAEPERFDATNDGGCPRFGYHRVLSFCMYDGWSYWQPHPAMLTEGVLGPEWHSLNSITGIAERAKPEGEEK